MLLTIATAGTVVLLTERRPRNVELDVMRTRLAEIEADLVVIRAELERLRRDAT